MLVQKDAPIKFRIHKANTGEGGYDMSDATFSVTPVDAEAEPLITEATDAAGDVDLSNLALAVDTDYTIAETKAPDGFKLDAEAVTVHIDADGTAALSGEALPAKRWTRPKTGRLCSLALTSHTCSSCSRPTQMALCFPTPRST